MTHDQTAINTLRFLAVDMVEQAASGHPGAPMGLAPLAYQLWTRTLRFDPSAPDWLNRDRFVLSAGHASALLYGLLHLAGFDLPIEELRRFRQLGSRTPGHPEHGLTAGVETTTGPLGQGLSNAVGIAIAERMLAAHFNRPGFDLFDHRTFVIASDGDLMEGVASEACSLAGHLGLGKLIVFYDSNDITIDGSTSLAFSENVTLRFQAYGWHTVEVDDGNDLDALAAATSAAIAESGRPSLVRVRTHIGFGSPGKQDSAEAHGAALGPAEVKATKTNLGWPLEPTFLVPDEARLPFAEAAGRGGAEHGAWRERRAAWAKAHPDLAAELERRLAGKLPQAWDEGLPTYPPSAPAIATRSVSGAVINALAPRLPELCGGSADLAESNSTKIKGVADFSTQHPEGRNLRFGVREHAMAAILNGMTLSGSDPAVRRHLPRLLRLHATGGAARRADEAAGRLRLHPRLDPARRGRTDAPARSAPGRAARDAQPDRPAPGRRARDGRRVASRDREPRRSHRVDPHAAEAAGARCYGRRRGRRPGFHAAATSRASRAAPPRAAGPTRS